MKLLRLRLEFSAADRGTVWTLIFFWKISSAKFIEKNLKKISTADFIEKIFTADFNEKHLKKNFHC
jgi:hypothetical protein